VPDSQSNQNITNPQIDTSNNRFSANQGYDYDQSGNVTKDATDKRFAYDAENKQTSFGTNGSSTNGGSYFYDGDGRRVKKVVGTETTIFVYNASGQLVAEYTTTAPPTIGTISYLTTDTLGSPRINTNASGQVTARHDYMPFGEEIIGLGNRTSTNGYQADNIRQKFTGYLRDEETNLDFAQARYYCSALGRFISVDPLFESAKPHNPQTWNRYSYVLNNPLYYVDPTGEKGEVTVEVDREKKTGTVSIKASFAVYAVPGNNVSNEQLQNQADLLKKQIEGSYKGSFTKDGITYSVSASITVQVVGSEKAAEDGGNSGKFDNIIGVVDNTQLMDVGNGENNKNAWTYNDGNFDRIIVAGGADLAGGNVYAHEFGHSLGFGHNARGNLMQPVSPHSPQITANDFNDIFGRTINDNLAQRVTIQPTEYRIIRGQRWPIPAGTKPDPNPKTKKVLRST
jgi:RHS repeat-associated protein